MMTQGRARAVARTAQHSLLRTGYGTTLPVCATRPPTTSPAAEDARA